MKVSNRVTLTAFAMLLVAFQNCSQVKFQGQGVGSTDLSSELALPDTTVTLTTPEDTPINAIIDTVSTHTGQDSTLSPLTSPLSGRVSGFNPLTGAFTYTPNRHFFGRDQFQYTESNPGVSRTLTHTVIVQVVRTGQPTILTDVVNFEMNTHNTPFTVQIIDNEVPDPWADLSADGSLSSINTNFGIVTTTPGGFVYTPGIDFRGTDHVTLHAHDSQGGHSSRTIALVVGNPLTTIQPGMAVRSSNCIQCHAQIKSNYVTDFGFGNKYFFGTDQRRTPGEDWAYALRLSAFDSAKKTYFPEWITTAEFKNSAQVIVPRANLGFTYRSFAPAGVDLSAEWLNATTVGQLLRDIQKIPGGTFKATIVEKDQIYIGAPSAATLRAAGQLDSTHKLRYWKDGDRSYDFSGLTLAAKGYYTNSAGVPLVCDGDLFVDGTVFLNQVKVKTINGCRLHATGPVFLQKAITYVTDPATQAYPNLQIVSARLISMGVGVTHCESATNAGWYSDAIRYGMDPLYTTNPIYTRTVWIAADRNALTRNTDPTAHFPLTANSPAEEGAYLVQQAKNIAGLDDASCHGRGVAFEHLLLVAPQIHSRYKGNFSGVIIAEFPLFSLSSFIYQFDPILLKVPILPLLDMDQILKVQ